MRRYIIGLLLISSSTFAMDKASCSTTQSIRPATNSHIQKNKNFFFNFCVPFVIFLAVLKDIITDSMVDAYTWWSQYNQPKKRLKDKEREY